MLICKPPRQSSGVFNRLFIFDNQALESGGNPVSLGVLPLSLKGQMNLFSLLIDLSDPNLCDYLDFSDFTVRLPVDLILQHCSS